MVIYGELVPMVYFYKNNELVWDYVLPNGIEKGRCGFKIIPQDVVVKEIETQDIGGE